MIQDYTRLLMAVIFHIFVLHESLCVALCEDNVP